MSKFRLFAFAAALLAGTAIAAEPPVSYPTFVPGSNPSPADVAAAPMPREKAELCCGLEFVGQELPAEGPKLGRAIPKEQYDIGNFRAVVGQDGKTRYFPRITKHANKKLRAAPIPNVINYGLKAVLTLKKMYLNNQYGCCVISSRVHQFGIVYVNGAPMPSPPTSVLLVQPAAEVPSGGHYCAWMPFQVGQAKAATAAA